MEATASTLLLASQRKNLRKVQPKRMAAPWQCETLCFMAYKDLEWHAMDDVEFEGMDEISEIVFLRVALPFWTT